MLLTDFQHLDGFLADHPPLDILAAAWLGVKPAGAQKKPSIREAGRMNSEALAQAHVPAPKRLKQLADMPAFLRTPEQLKMIESMRAQWKNSE